MWKLTIIGAAVLLLASCQAEEVSTADQEPVVRGLKTVVVKDQESSTVRRFPSVLQPSEVTTMSFEISGKLGPIDLKVGQVVKKGEVLAQLDTRTLDIQVESSQAAVRQAEATAENAAANLKRQQDLFDKKVTTRAVLDNAQTDASTSAEALAQAKKQLETSIEDLDKAELKSTIDGIINSVVMESFAIVSPGSPVATLYRADEFEASFSVSYDVVQRLTVGKQVAIRLSDNPSIILKGVVSELGSKADTVSSFPIVVTLLEANPALKAGMAVEVSVEFVVPTGQGYLMPLTVLPLFGTIDPETKPEKPSSTQVYVYDPDTQSVKTRSIKIAGVRENSIIVIDGLNAGERVASAGVSFLRDGQKVKLLPDSQ